MGRITIFASDGCSHCHRTFAALDARSIPYTVISITRYPEKRSDMLAISMQFSAPQVFFNTRHVGGADATIALLEKWDRSVRRKSSDSCDGAGSVVDGTSVCSIQSAASTTSRESHNNNNSSRSRKRRSYSSVLERYNIEIAKYPDPSDKRLAVPDYPPTVSSETATPYSRIRETLSFLPSGGAAGDGAIRTTHLELMETLKTILPLHDNSQGRIMYKNSCTGEQVVKALQSQFDLLSSEQNAVDMGSELLRLKILHSLNDSGGGESTRGLVLKNNSRSFYRLQCHHTPDVLNSYRIWATTDSAAAVEQPESSNAAAASSMQLLSQLITMLEKVEMTVTDDQGRCNLKKAAQLHEYAVFEEAVCELQQIDFGTMDDTTKIAFGINLYNLMIKYSSMKVGVCTNSMARSTFYSAVKFNIGGLLFSFQEFEHGILRGNAKAPHSLRSPFGKKDPRISLAVKNPDSRIHFGLNCGAKSCPPIRVFSAEHLEEELAIVAASFCEDDDNVYIDAKKQEIRVSKIFGWYRADFTDNLNQLPEVLSSYMRGMKKQALDRVLSSCSGHLKVSFLEYDWSTNSSDQLVFNAEVLKPNRKGMRILLGGKKTSKTSSSAEITAQ